MPVQDKTVSHTGPAGNAQDRDLCGEAASCHGASVKTRWRTAVAVATFPEAVRENEEVVPVNAVSTWVLPSGVTAGR